MPMSIGFQERITPILNQVVEHFGTPFHIYDEYGIRETGAALKSAFSGFPYFKEYFAVKALPNPSIMEIMQDMGFGFDCSSIPELSMARSIGARGSNIMFTSNNTTPEEFQAALSDGGCLLNLDDITFVDKVPSMPDYNLFSV